MSATLFRSILSLIIASLMMLSSYVSSGAWADIPLSQKGETKPMPEPDSTERLSIPGNWILSRTFISENGVVSYDDITYYDDLGYTSQIVNSGASPEGRNIIRPIMRDEMRRDDALTFLSYVSDEGSTGEIPLQRAINEQASWYRDNGYKSDFAYAFTSRKYEKSPLGRLIESREAGKLYAEQAENRPVKHSYDVNGENEVLYLKTDESGNLIISGWRAKAKLIKISSTDEDGCISFRYLDMDGNEVLKRRMDGNIAYDTYCVYDPYGRILWSISPEGSLRLSNGRWTWPEDDDINDSPAAKWCFLYRYDGRGRMIEKKQAGKAVEKFVYSKSGREVMRQDGNLREHGKWIATEYDKLGHVTESLVISGIKSREEYQNMIDDGITPLEFSDKSKLSLRRVLYGNYTEIPGMGLEYNPEYSLHFTGIMNIVEHSEIDLKRVNGLKTYEKIAELSSDGASGRYVERAFYYNSDGRPVQIVEKDTDGKENLYSYKYDFSGLVLSEYESHSDNSGIQNDKTTKYYYDKRGRLASKLVFVNSKKAEMSYSYDLRDRLTSIAYMCDTDTLFVKDSWNIQGRLESRTARYGNNDIFTMSLRYGDTPTKQYARYSGTISEWEWKQGDNPLRKYTFTYDDLHRMNDSFLTEDGIQSPLFTESGISYDRNGNILSVNRTGATGTSPERFVFSYNGNRRTDLKYDANGNATGSSSSGIDIKFNLINLPTTISSAGETVAEYNYLSDGTKKSVKNKNGSGLQYKGSFRYNADGILREIGFGEGRIFRDTAGKMNNITYQITDHTGSVRVMTDSYGDIMERNDFYPFGTRLPDKRLPFFSDNLHRFAGKEEQYSLSGMEWLDFGARMYGNLQWQSMDSKAELFPDISPYSFCNDDPIRFTDPSGKIVRPYKLGELIMIRNTVPALSLKGQAEMYKRRQSQWRQPSLYDRNF